MPLNDTAIRNIKPKDRPFKLADGNGLYLFVTPTGSRLWRLKYRFGGHERTLSIGAYPAVTIKMARDAREQAKTMLATGIDPSQAKQASKLKEKEATLWFWAAYLMATHSNGISALQLQSQLGLGSYKSAWLLCAKLRRAMVAPSRALLSGVAEVDETELPLRAKDDPVTGAGGRSGQGKMLVAGAVEVADGGPGRIRLAKIPDFSAKSLHGFVAANMSPGATIKTDGWSAYPGAPGVAHDPHVIGKMAAHVVLPWVHRVFANVKTWALGVYHGLREKHLQSYLDEFVFRFNRRKTRHAAFRSLLAIGLAAKAITYKMLITPEGKG